MVSLLARGVSRRDAHARVPAARSSASVSLRNAPLRSRGLSTPLNACA